MATGTPALRRTLALLGICGFAYLYVFPYQSRINNPNENVRLYMTAALVEEGGYEIDSMRERWGWVNDAAVLGGHAYSVKAPGTSLLGVPAYALYLHGARLLGRPFDRTEALWACRVFASVLPTLVWLFFFHRWLARRSERALLCDAVFLSVALGSLLYGYALVFVSHTLSAVVAFAAFMLVYDVRGGGPVSAWRAFWIGFFAAAVTLFEYPGLVASVVLTVYAVIALRRPRVLAACAVGGAIPTLALMHFHWRAFGNPLLPGHLFVESEGLRAAHHQGIYGAVGPSLKALHGLAIDPGAGLFPLTPILVFALVGFAVLLRDRARRPDALVAALLALLTLLAIASMNNWRGGWTIGPRYLAVAVPFLAWGALEGLDVIADRSESIAAVLALGATAAALVASGVPSAYFPHFPPDITRPLPDVVWLLLRHDFAPRNAGAWLGVHGTASMAPVFAAMLAGLAACLSAVAGVRARAWIALGAAIVALVLLLPHHLGSAGAPAVADARAFITTRWTPAGHDVVARLARELKARRTVADSDLRRLAELYEEEGRVRDAVRARAGRF